MEGHSGAEADLNNDVEIKIEGKSREKEKGRKRHCMYIVYDNINNRYTLWSGRQKE